MLRHQLSPFIFQCPSLNIVEQIQCEWALKIKSPFTQADGRKHGRGGGLQIQCVIAVCCGKTQATCHVRKALPSPLYSLLMEGEAAEQNCKIPGGAVISSSCYHPRKRTLTFCNKCGINTLQTSPLCFLIAVSNISIIFLKDKFYLNELQKGFPCGQYTKSTFYNP